MRSSPCLTAFELLKYAAEQRIEDYLCNGEAVDEKFEYFTCQVNLQQ